MMHGQQNVKFKVDITEMYPRIPWIRSWIAWNPRSTLLPVILGSSPDHRYAGRLDRQITFGGINFEVIRIRAKYILEHGMEVKVSHW